MDQKKSSVKAQFGRRAGAYARSESHARDLDLDLLLEHLNLSDSDHVLDVATGTGFTAIAVRPRVTSVTGLDLTHGMLREAIRLAADAARSWSATQPAPTIHWVEGDVEALPFRDDVFSVVTCRRAPHHFVQFDRAIDEMLRVLQPGGRVGLIDQISPEETDGMQLMEALETLRDSSHVHALSVSEWQAAFSRRQIALTFLHVVESRLAFQRWLELADTESEQRRSIEQALSSATPEARNLIGFSESPEPSFLKRWVVLVGRKTREHGSAGTR
ncbi:MAG: methyltransferase domain-containing protein [bacterium]